MLKAALGIVFFPVLPVIALFHGIFWIIKNILKNTWATVGIPLAGPSMLRKYLSLANKGENSAIAICICAWIFMVVSLGMFPVLAIRLDGGRFEETTWLLKVAFLVGCTNILSALYEGGRAYWNWLTKKKSGQEVPVSAKTETKQDDEDDDDPIDNFMRLLNQIEGILNSDSFEETIKALLEEIEKLFKAGDLTFKQVRHLGKLIDNAEAEKVGLAKV